MIITSAQQHLVENARKEIKSIQSTEYNETMVSHVMLFENPCSMLCIHTRVSILDRF